MRIGTVHLIALALLAPARLAAAQPARTAAPYDVAMTPREATIVDASDEGTGPAAVVWIDSEGSPGGGLVGFAGSEIEAQFALDNPPDMRAGDVGIAGLPDGGYVAVWEAISGSTSRILLQCIGADGVPLPAVTRIDPGTQLHPGRPAVAAGPGGRALAVWEQDTVDSSDIEGRFLDGCTPASDVFAITPRAAGLPSHPDVAADADDRFLVSWRSARADATGIEALLLGPDGVPLGPVNTFVESDVETAPAVVADPRGGFLTAWLAREDERRAIRARRLDPPNLMPGGLLTLALVPALQGGTPSLAYQQDGTLMAVWRAGSSVVARSYGPNGVPHDQAFRMSELADPARSPHVMAGPNSRYLVTWMSNRGAGAQLSSAVRAQLLSLCGNAVLDPGEACDDGNARDDDCCSGTCEPLDADGECWALSRRSVLKATTRITLGGIRTCRTRCQMADRTLLVLGPGGAYRIVGNIETCSDGRVIAFPDELGNVEAKGRRLATRPTNVDELDAVRLDCSGAQLTQITGAFRRSANRQALRGRQTTALRQVGEIDVDIRIRTSVAGGRSDTGPFPELPPRRRGLFECSLPLQLDCGPPG
jgi:cysteine-rich repeat protein